MDYYDIIHKMGFFDITEQIKKEFLFNSCEVKLEHDLNTYTNKKLFRITFHGVGNFYVDKYLVLELTENDENLYIGINALMILKKDIERIFKCFYRDYVIDNLNT